MIAARLLAVAGSGGSFVNPGEGGGGGGGSAFDEDFTTPLSGFWTVETVAGPDGDVGLYPGTADADTTVPNRFYGRAENDTYVYAYKPCPTPPFVATLHITAAALQLTNPADIAFGIGNPGTGYIQIANPSCFSGNILNVETMTWGDLSTFTNSFDEAPLAPGYGGPFPPIYLRLTVASATDVTASWSWDNRLYADKWTHRNPTASPGNLSAFNPSHVIIALHPGVSQVCEVLIDSLTFS